MKLHLAFLAASALLALLCPTAVQADDGILSFELSPPQWVESPSAAEAIAPSVDNANQPLPIPAQAANPPMRYHSPQQLPAGVYRRGVAVGLNESTSATALLPPPPPLALAPVMVAAAPAPATPEPKVESPKETQQLALDFGLEPSAAMIMAQAKLAEPKAMANPLLSLFEGHSDSLVARAVGSAEGTRAPNGAINPAYFGHTDPGNRVWNMGTFSYQHGAQTPEEADQKQLARLQNQGDVLHQRALKHGLNLTLEETLNGLDLANQSPLAAIGRVGYIERLAEAKANGYEGSEAIVVARTRSYINPNTGRWNAPGLGNTEPSIRRDQQRRANAVVQAIAAYEAQNPDLHPQTWVLTPTPEPATPVAPDIAAAEPGDEVLQMWTSPSDPIAQAEPANEAIATAPEPNEPGTDPLAALWQVTVERFSQAAFPSGGNTSPQAASLANLLFNRDDTPSSSAIPDRLLGTSSLPNASQIEPPAWANAKEGSQPIGSSVTITSPIPGAFPDSTVYMPQPSAPAPKHPAFTSQEDAEVLADPAIALADPLPTLAPTSEPAELGITHVIPVAEPQVSPLEIPSPADLTIAPAPEQPLGFEQVGTDDFSVETLPAQEESAGEEAIAPPTLPSEIITPDTAREGASVQ